MSVDVRSEIGRLEQVLVHRPGAEIVRMTQHELERLLFDDILSPTEAAREHDLLVELLRAGGGEVVELLALLESALNSAADDDIDLLLHHACAVAGGADLAGPLRDLDPAQLAHVLIEGIRWQDLQSAPSSLARVRASVLDSSQWALRPLPNLMFMRDPCAAVFDRVVVGTMATQARRREPLLVSFALAHGHGVAQERQLPTAGVQTADAFRSLEGGDVLVPDPRFLLIGCSQRTTAQTIDSLTRDALFSAFPDLERVYVVLLPDSRSMMHLDTILTQVDRKIFLGHAPVIEGNADNDPLPVVRIAREGPPEHVTGASVLDILRDELGRDVELVPCGGVASLHQQREQWTDGANAIALAPGHVVLYARNVHTIAALGERGFREVRLHVAQTEDERRALIEDGLRADRVVFAFSGSELSRARGGGRCLTMPLRREALSSST